jgi:S-adenosylmethionine:tRNA ribosyltransferase-isomerase
MAPMTKTYTLSDFDYQLPPALIAQHPAPERSGSRLLDASAGGAVDRAFGELPALLQPKDLLVFNDTKVIKARLQGVKATGGSAEALVERVLPGTREVWAHVRASKSPRAGSRIRFAGAFEAQVLGRCGPRDGLFHLRFDGDPLTLLERHGHVPLPPYITHEDSADDLARYQTVFATKPGAVAAPTAALHFDEALLAALPCPRSHVTLHVGAGTFQPVRTENLAEHEMHTEWFEVPQATVDAIAACRQRGGRVVAVGTTTLRALESAAVAAGPGCLRAGAAETSLFITPGFAFQVVDLLVTNFHLPKSTLMMLVSAFCGFGEIRGLYEHAVQNKYRFFSYGDAMLLARRESVAE